MLLIGNVLMAPAKGFMSIIKVLYQKAVEEIYDPEKIKEELMALQVKLDMGELSEDDYDELEELLLTRLEESRKMQSL